MCIRDRASIVNNHTIAALAIEQFGSPEQQKHYLPKLAKGETLGALALFESGPTPGVGPDALTAVKHAEGWVLNGKKAYVRNAGVAGVYIVFACLLYTSSGISGEPRHRHAGGRGRCGRHGRRQ